MTTFILPFVHFFTFRFRSWIKCKILKKYSPGIEQWLLIKWYCNNCRNDPKFFVFQMFPYPNLSPISGILSPTTYSWMASPGGTPRTTPRSTPTPRWTSPYVSLDEYMDNTNMTGQIYQSGNSDENILQDGKYHTMFEELLRQHFIKSWKEYQIKKSWIYYIYHYIYVCVYVCVIWIYDSIDIA